MITGEGRNVENRGQQEAGRAGEKYHQEDKNGGKWESKQGNERKKREAGEDAG